MDAKSGALLVHQGINPHLYINIDLEREYLIDWTIRSPGFAAGKLVDLGDWEGTAVLSVAASVVVEFAATCTSWARSFRSPT